MGVRFSFSWIRNLPFGWIHEGCSVSPPLKSIYFFSHCHCTVSHPVHRDVSPNSSPLYLSLQLLFPNRRKRETDEDHRKDPKLDRSSAYQWRIKYSSRGRLDLAKRIASTSCSLALFAEKTDIVWKWSSSSLRDLSTYHYYFQLLLSHEKGTSQTRNSHEKGTFPNQKKRHYSVKSWTM